MKKRIKDSLNIKIFLLTSCLLLFVSAMTYTCVAKFLPVTYKNELEEDLQKVSEQLQEELGRYQSVEEAENLLMLFEANNQASLTLLDSSGNMVFPKVSTVVYEQVVEYSEIPEVDGVSEQNYGERSGQDDEILEKTQEEKSSATPEKTDLSDNYGITVMVEDVVLDSADNSDLEYQGRDNTESSYSALKSYQVKIGEETYTMLIVGTMQAVDQTMKILREIFPMIMGVIGIIALICALSSAVYLTKPIMRLSRISRKMASLQFDEKCQENRTDEVGVLARSLNELSDNLSASMESLKEANRKLKSDMEKEREEERKRTAFFAAASHELKTPVTILKGHLGGMIQNIGAYQDREPYLKRSYEVTETMEGMVKEILMISKMESGAWELKKEQADLAELVRLQIAEVLELLEKKKMELLVEIPEHFYAAVDRTMMVKVFRNLFVNAIRYSPEGASIRIFLQEQNQRMFFLVENTGIHIPMESLPRLFDAFYRVEDSRNRKSGGSGLGLYIVRMILEQHGAAYGAGNSTDGVQMWFLL